MTLRDAPRGDSPHEGGDLAAGARVDALVGALTLEEKIAQLYGVWVGASDDGGEVAPNQNQLLGESEFDLDRLIPLGLGQLTRPFGTAPVDAALGALSLMRTQERIVRESRHGIPAVAHEECLAGFAAWGATAYPVPVSWGATFDPEIIERMGAAIGADLRSVGIHQGLAPVLDVVRDARWGRVEETIGEDPYLVGSIGAAYVRGVESSGVIATVKHFVGYSASKAGRNLAPVSIGKRELADVLLPPFEMVVREGRPRSVMNAYTDIDGVPSAADGDLLTGLLRDTWGFDGTLVSDYFTIAFLKTLHGTAGSWGDAAAAALIAGVDVELPTVHTFGDPLVEAVRDGRIGEEVIDRALRRVLEQKAELGLLSGGWSPVPPVLEGRALEDAEALRGTVDLDPPENRALARAIAEQAVVMLRNDGTLPLAASTADVSPRIAVIGPNADDPYSLLGCYSFPAHIGVHHPGLPMGISLPTLLDAVRAEFPGARVDHAAGTTIDGGETDGIPAAVTLAGDSDVVVLALGDRSGLFGRGTSGEGCDVESLELPGAQQALLDALIASGTPVVVVLLAGRPYSLGAGATEAAAILQTFFPGEEGSTAIAAILSGRVNPSGRLPVSIPRSPGAQPSTYLAPLLATANRVSSVDPTPAFPFGAGIGYSSIEWSDLDADVTETGTDGSVTLALTLRNAGARAGSEVVQLYLHDPLATVVRPLQRLIGFVKVPLEPGETVRVSVEVPSDLAAFTGVDGRRIVEPGELVLGFGRSSGDIPLASTVVLNGPVRVVGPGRALHPRWSVAR
jgi:beta-xylosidase